MQPWPERAAPALAQSLVSRRDQAMSPTAARPDRSPMLSLDEAVSRLLEGARAHAIVETESVSTFDALGRVLAEDGASHLDVPPADNSAMDGYALRVADVPAAGTVLPVTQRMPAGQRRRAAAAGQRGAHLHRRADSGRRRRGRDAGAVRGDAVRARGDWSRARPGRAQRRASGSAAAAKTCARRRGARRAGVR